MEHIGIDVHKRESQICVVAEDGELVEQRIRTEPERFAVSSAFRVRVWQITSRDRRRPRGVRRRSTLMLPVSLFPPTALGCL